MKILPMYTKIVEKLSTINPIERGLVRSSTLCTNIKHLEFCVKSEYGLGQLSTVLNFVKIGDFLYAVNNGNLYFDSAIKGNEDGTFKKYNLIFNFSDELESLLL